MIFDSNEQKRHIFIGFYVIYPNFKIPALCDDSIKKVIKRNQESGNCYNPGYIVPILEPI